MRRHAGLRIDVARRRHGAKPGQKSQWLIRNRNRSPTQLAKRQSMIDDMRRRLPEGEVNFAKAADMPDGGAYTIEPGSFIRATRRCERRARQLLGIKPVLALLRAVLSLRQRAWQRLGLEIVSEAGQVVQGHRRPPYSPWLSASLLRRRRSRFKFSYRIK